MSPAKNKSSAHKIIQKLQENSHNGLFVRHKNRNTKDNRVCNLEWVSLRDALLHPRWKVDWTMDLSKEEILFVRINKKNFIECCLV